MKLADPRRKIRAAWPPCDVAAVGPRGESAASRYYLFSAGEIADGGGGGVAVVRAPEKILAALGRLAAEPNH